MAGDIARERQSHQRVDVGGAGKEVDSHDLVSATERRPGRADLTGTIDPANPHLDVVVHRNHPGLTGAGPVRRSTLDHPERTDRGRRGKAHRHPAQQFSIVPHATTLLLRHRPPRVTRSGVTSIR
jgi:hypothetical protein